MRYETRSSYWDLEVAGPELVIRSGPHGTAPVISVETFDSEDAALDAQHRWAKQTYEQHRHDGFALVPPAPVVAPRTFTRGAETWTITLEDNRVHDGEVVQAYPTPGDALAAYNQRLAARLAAGFVEREPRNPELERAIADEPRDRDAYAVLGDWLQQQGDPRGELIALELAGRYREARAFVREHAAALLGPLAEHAVCYDGLWHDPARDALHWRYGFIHRARMSYMQVWNDHFSGSIADVLELLLLHPSGRFLTELALMYNEDVADNDQQPLLDVLARLAPASLRRLVIGDHVDQLSWYRIGDLGSLWPAVPRLETLELEGAEVTLGVIDAPALVRFELVTSGLSAAAATSIARARWPRLEELVVYFGDPTYGGECSVEHARAILARDDLPALRHLGLCDATFTDAIAEVLPGSRLLPQLRSLDLAHGILTDDGARTLARHRDAFAHLDVLDVSDNYLTAAGRELVAGLAKHVIADDQKDDEGDPDLRYVSFGE